MSIKHDRRQAVILEIAVNVFTELGYENVTLQKIADRCKITRTTLYLYFHNKEEIFTHSIQHKLRQYEKKIREIIKDNRLNSKEKLATTIFFLLDEMDKNKKLLRLILAYLINLNAQGVDCDRLVRKNVVKMRHLFSEIFIMAKKSSEMEVNSIRCANSVAISILEGVALKIAFGGDYNIYGTKKVVIHMIKTMECK